MKASELPDKIYVDTPNHDFWYRTKDSNSIEYTRTDAFIKRACEWLDDELCCYIKAQDFTIDYARLNKDFKEYMKGE